MSDFTVTIVTTVYDRVACLERCLRSVSELKFTDYEHIVVADCPPAAVLAKIEAVVAGYEKATLTCLKSRHNDWGISPAAEGLSLARGKYICFLSDDNGYLPEHFDPLVSALEEDPELGFAYSSCLYAGKKDLRAPAPAPGRIDLGQPLFRRELFDRHLEGRIPFREFGWDWRMIERLLQKGVRWKHIDRATFIFRLDQYPQKASIDRPTDFASWRGFHKAETFIVCGCGASLGEIVAPERFTTIGVNDVGRLFQPDYLVVVNPRSQFSGDRFRYVENSRAAAVFTQLDLGISHPNVVRFRLGRRGGTDLSDASSLPYTRNSPYVAMCLALHMGAKRIGLIGVDFTDHHFFGSTGRHSLAGELSQIDKEYAALAMTCRQMGVEVFNLSAASRLTAFPKISPQDFARTSLVPADAAAALNGSKVFFVNYRFLSCGEVFSDGLSNAALDLDVQTESGYWDDSDLPAKINRFAPDLLFVVHGRRYSQRWKANLHQKSGIWLLDEPYEVDDTARFSKRFNSVFVNDPATLRRHPNAHYLPVCYDPAIYYCRPGQRTHNVGFIGGGNPARETMLAELARRGLLSYAVGGPWRDAEVRRLCLSGNIPAAQSADLYRQTKIVVNVFRTQHHFNRDRIPATSMNPRVYEALACGALVISERRREIEQLCPEMPLFDGTEQLVSTIESLLADPARYERVRKACIRRLAGHTYAHRLHTVLGTMLEKWPEQQWSASSVQGIPAAPVVLSAPVSLPGTAPAPSAPPPAQAVNAQTATATMQTPAATQNVNVLPGWEGDARSVRQEDDAAIVLHNLKTAALAGETGMTANAKHADVRMSFEVMTEPGAIFIAKIHSQEPRNPRANSYHLVVNGLSAYVARHNKVLQRVSLRNAGWEAIAMIYRHGMLAIEVNGTIQCAIADDTLTEGYCFLGVQTGVARVRNVAIGQPADVEVVASVHPEFVPMAAPPAVPRPAMPTQAKLSEAGVPFTATPVRNLIYHIWPVQGSMWRWNIDQLKARIDLFNGRRVIGIVHDKRSDDPEAVQAALEGHGCEFVVAANHPSGEVVTFPTMLRRIASTDPNEVTFYGHAKGVRHEPSVSNAVRQWADVSYRASLDDWRGVRSQMERYALTGSFRMFGRFRSHRHAGDWHYSGTYYWMRHARVFAKDCFAVPPFYCGVEAWPGKHFARHEAGCLLFDDVRQLAYDERFWHSRREEIERWEAAKSCVEPPPDLDGLPCEGAKWPPLRQRPDEFSWLLEKLPTVAPRKILTIGADQAAKAWHIARTFRSLGQAIEVTALGCGPEVLEGQGIKLIGDRAQLDPQYDVILIDGDRSYSGARSDFELALSRSPRLVALHNIADSDWQAQNRCCVSRLWTEISGRYPSESRASGEWGGIGVIDLSGKLPQVFRAVTDERRC